MFCYNHVTCTSKLLTGRGKYDLIEVQKKIPDRAVEALRVFGRLRNVESLAQPTILSDPFPIHEGQMEWSFFYFRREI